MRIDHRLKFIVFIVVLAVVAAFNVEPIAQDPAYHQFADQRSIGGVANFFNVLSNLPFIIIGIMGLRLLAAGGWKGGLPSLHNMYFVFFLGVLATGLGSSYYHLQPDNKTLVWDRLPMTIAFMALFCIIVGEYISERAAQALFVPLLLAGLASVLYWHLTELYHQGDLRPYALVQFLPMVLIPAILCLYRSGLQGDKYFWGILAVYGLSKVLEYYDVQLYAALGILSGHSLKHLAAAVGPYIFYRALHERNGGGGS